MGYKKEGVYQRGSTWTYVADGPRKDDGSRKQITKGGFRTKKEAKAARIKLLNEINEGNYINPSKVSFSTFTLTWYEDYKARVGVTTADNRWHILNKHLLKENTFAQKSISEINTKVIDEFLTRKFNNGYKSNTVNRIRTFLNLIYQLAYNWDMIKKKSNE